MGLTYLCMCVCSTVMRRPVHLLVTILVTVHLQSLVLVLVYNIDFICIICIYAIVHILHIFLSGPWMSWQSFCDESCFHVELGLFLLIIGIFFKLYSALYS